MVNRLKRITREFSDLHNDDSGLPLGDRSRDDEVRRREHDVLAAAAAVVTTSAWPRRRLAELYALPADRVHVAEPAVEAADLASGTGAGGALLCVAAVTSGKGHDVLLEALATTTDLSWKCVCSSEPSAA